MAGRPPEERTADDGPAPTSIAGLARELRSVVRTGVDRAVARPELSELRSVRRRARAFGDDRKDGLSLAWRGLVRDALDALDDGAFSHATRLLFGAVPDTRGRPVGERRRIAADSLDLAHDTFRKNHEPQLLTDVAAEIYRLEHQQPEPTTTATTADEDEDLSAGFDPIVAVDATGLDPAISPEPDAGGLPRLRARGRARRRGRVADTGHTEAAGRGIPQVVALAAPPAQLYRQLEAIRDWQAGVVWAVVFLLGGVLVAWRWGLDSVPVYVAALAAAGLVSTTVRIVAVGRSARRHALYEQWPKIVLLVLTGGLSVWLIAGQDTDDADGEAAGGSCQLSPGSAECTSTTTPTTLPVPNSVPVTYAAPHQLVAPQCPAPGNGVRRISFSDVPPLCIDPERTYVATVHTNYGSFDMALDAADATHTVNNFVYLARWRFYDGTTLTPFPQPEISATYLTSTDPVETQHRARAPGYGMVLDRHQGPYPDDDVYAVATNPERPHRWSLVIADDARQQIATNPQAFPVLGTVTTCRDIVADPTGDGDLQPRVTDTPIVIDTITIHEHPAGTLASTDRQDPHCRDQQQRP